MQYCTVEPINLFVQEIHAADFEHMGSLYLDPVIIRDTFRLSLVVILLYAFHHLIGHLFLFLSTASVHLSITD